MININYLNIDLEQARKDHFEFFKCFLTKKLTGKDCIKTTKDKSHPERPKFCNGYENKEFRYKIHKKLVTDFLIKEGRLDDLIVGSPKRLKILNDKFIERIDKHFGNGIYDSYTRLKSGDRSKFRPAKVHQFFIDLGQVFNYKILSTDKDYNSYTLSSNLGIRSCVYCNRTYTVTQRKRKGIKNGRLMSPQLDHWFPQSKYPLLQISFHNLIPSCEICNSRVKNDHPFNVKDHFHPYQNFDASIKFSYRFSYLNDKYQIYFKDWSDEKILRTCKAMYIDQMYDAHEEELIDLITIEKKYSKEYLKSLKSSFPGANLSEQLVYRLAFGTELHSTDFHKRPMSKFKHDILVELGIIKP